MEAQPKPYLPCASHLGRVATACELVRVLTYHEQRHTGQTTPPDTEEDELVAQLTDTVAKSVVTLQVLGCSKGEESLINELT